MKKIIASVLVVVILSAGFYFMKGFQRSDAVFIPYGKDILVIPNGTDQQQKLDEQRLRVAQENQARIEPKFEKSNLGDFTQYNNLGYRFKIEYPAFGGWNIKGGSMVDGTTTQGFAFTLATDDERQKSAGDFNYQSTHDPFFIKCFPQLISSSDTNWVETKEPSNMYKGVVYVSNRAVKNGNDCAVEWGGLDTDKARLDQFEKMFRSLSFYK